MDLGPYRVVHTDRQHAKTLVFDLDGTLLDSLTDIVLSFQYAFKVLGLRPPSEAEVRAQIGRPLEAMVSSFMGTHIAAICAIYCEHYPKHFAEHTVPKPGVEALLQELRARGYTLVVATTKRSTVARELLEAVGLAAHIDFVQGTDGFPHKPAPDVIYRALGAVRSEGLWMIGDTVGDIEAGRAAGLSTYAVTWGTQDAETLCRARPDVLFHDLSGLLELT